MSLPLMIFAAGFGTRMGPLTRTRPKPLIEVGGTPLIDRALALAVEAGAAPVIVNLHYMAGMLAQHLAGRDVLLSHEAPEILDTGGGLKQALARGDWPVVATLNPDALWSGPNPLHLLAQSWDPDRMDALLACVPLERTIGRSGGGDFRIDGDGRLARSGDYVYGGAQIIRADCVRNIGDRVFSLNRAWDAIMRENRLYAVVYPGRWCDVGTPDGLALAEEMVAQDV